jgi:hypothetical protein
MITSFLFGTTALTNSDSSRPLVSIEGKCIHRAQPGWQGLPMSAGLSLFPGISIGIAREYSQKEKNKLQIILTLATQTYDH